MVGALFLWRFERSRQSRQRHAVDDLWGFKTIISAMDQQSEALKKLEDKIKILEDKADEMERSLKQR